MTPSWFEPVFRDLDAPFVHGMTNDRGPDLGSDPRLSDHARAVEQVGLAAGVEAIAWAHQVHGDVVLRVDGPGCAGDADALWTDRAGLAVMGRSADCPIVLIGGRRGDESPVWGMAHASWRSTALDITGRLLDAMIEGGLRPATVAAAIAPSAGPCCYEVGWDVREEFMARLGDAAADVFRPLQDRWILDLWSANSASLKRRGVFSECIELDGRCTICGRGFPSYRREGSDSGRFGVLLGC